jgi:hypothetical protein
MYMHDIRPGQHERHRFHSIAVARLLYGNRTQTNAFPMMARLADARNEQEPADVALPPIIVTSPRFDGRRVRAYLLRADKRAQTGKQ